jgi:hypothetical protein
MVLKYQAMVYGVLNCVLTVLPKYLYIEVYCILKRAIFPFKYEITFKDQNSATIYL